MRLHDWTRVDPNDFHDFHHGWIGGFRHVLNRGLLPDGYYAVAEHTMRPYVPDVLTLKAGEIGAAAPDSGVVTLAAPPRARVVQTGVTRSVRVPREKRIAIRHTRGRRLVAAIEILSPSNKASRADLVTFTDKVVSLLLQGVHTLVVDVFPPTVNDPDGVHGVIWKALVKGASFTRPADKPATLASYAAVGTKAYTAYVEPIAVGDELPDVPLFLTPGQHVSVPVGAAYQYIWDDFAPPVKDLLESPG